MKCNKCGCLVDEYYHSYKYDDLDYCHHCVLEILVDLGIIKITSYDHIVPCLIHFFIPIIFCSPSFLHIINSFTFNHFITSFLIYNIRKNRAYILCFKAILSPYKTRYFLRIKKSIFKTKTLISDL